MFYLFGVLLIYLGWRQIRPRKQNLEFRENIVLRALRKLIPPAREEAIMSRAGNRGRA